MTVMYDDAFYSSVREGAKQSAIVVQQLLQLHLDRVKRVVDVGGGEGWWAWSWVAAGKEVLAIDNHPEPPAGSPLALTNWLQADLMQPLPPEATRRGRFDLALCLEVGEHLPASGADQLVASLAALSDNILWSAAIPGQGGHGHCNERWPDYWVARFKNHSYKVSGELRWDIWNDTRIEPWYRQNLLFASKRPQDYPYLFDLRRGDEYPAHVVHPVLWDARRQR